MTQTKKDDYVRRQRSTMLLMHNASLLKEFMPTSKKFTFEEYQKFLIKKMEDTEKDEALTGPKKPEKPKNEKTEMNKAIISFLENDNKEFKKVVLQQRQKLVTEMLQVDNPRYERFEGALDQLDFLQCRLENNKLIIQGRISTETGFFGIKTYDLSPHMELIKKEKMFKKSNKGKQKTPGQVMVAALAKIIKGSPKSNLATLKSHLKLKKNGQSNIIDIAPSKIYNVLYNLQTAYDVHVVQEKAGVKSVINEDLEVNR